LKEHQPSVARATAVKLYKAAQSLRKFPRRGRIGRLAGTPELVILPLPYIIVYLVEGQTVQIVHVVHTSENWPIA
jgi:toxin ParE1/3/4